MLGRLHGGGELEGAHPRGLQPPTAQELNSPVLVHIKNTAHVRGPQEDICEVRNGDKSLEESLSTLHATF